MAKMIDLAYDENHRWKPNESIPKHIQIDSITHKTEAPTRREMAGYALAKPRQGMPFATAGLDAKEYTTLMAWLEQGAKFDTAPPQPTKVEKSRIAEWEELLNSQDDLEHRLVGRYLFEHMYAFHCYFDIESPHFFALVRSSTPPGQPAKPISTRFANSEIKGAAWYRFMVVDLEIHLKRHVPKDCTGDALQLCKQMLFKIPFTVDELPGFSDEERLNPLTTFAAIPAKSRYNYLLRNAFLHEQCVTTGPSCRGSLNVSTTPEQTWRIFENPETSLLCNDQEYYDSVAPLLYHQRQLNGIFNSAKTLRQYFDASEKSKAILVKKRVENPRSNLSDIWKGDRPDDIVAYTLVRHDDNAFLIPGLCGPFPAGMNLDNLATIERRYYISDVNFDVFSNVGEIIATRDNYADNRLDCELNYLRFYPPGQRNQELMRMYRHGVKDPIIKAKLPGDINFPSQFDFKTDNVRIEFMTAVMEHLKEHVPVHDNIFRPGQGVEVSAVAKAFRHIADRASALYGNEATSFRQYLGESTIVRVDSEGKDPAMYTLAVTWGTEKLGFVGNIFLRPEVKYDRIEVYETVMTAYPNFMFHVKDTEAMEFAKTLTAANSEAKMLAVVDRWGVRRTNPNFWEIFHSAEDYMRKQNARYAGILDANRYHDYSLGNMPENRVLDPRMIPGGQSGLQK